MIIKEGLVRGDLADTVFDIISIDEYESKLDDDAIVIAFFCNDKNAADDLNVFVQKSACEIVDSEVSPAPTSDGHYVVFVEFLRSENFVNNLTELLEDVMSLTLIKTWKFKPYGHNSIINLSLPNIKKWVRLGSKEDWAKTKKSVT